MHPFSSLFTFHQKLFFGCSLLQKVFYTLLSWKTLSKKLQMSVSSYFIYLNIYLLIKKINKIAFFLNINAVRKCMPY